jgi:broad specificity phosphatase PhoE
MVKIYIIRHAQSELNLLKEQTAKQYELDLDEFKLYLCYKFLNRDHLLDAPITDLGHAQCKIANLLNKDKFKNVRIKLFCNL